MSTAPPASYPLGQLTSADFSPRRKECFRVVAASDLVIDLELVEVKDLNMATAARPDGRRPFSLEFLGPVSRQYLPQATYPLEHPAFGVLEIFLVPLGPTEGRMLYEAIFT